MNKKLTISDLIHFYLSHYCSPVPYSSGCGGSMWSEMNEIKGYYCQLLNGSGLYAMKEIVRMCVRGLYTTGHQKRVKEDAIDEAVEKLMIYKFRDYNRGQECRLVTGNRVYNKFVDFEELYEAVRQLIGNINGIGYVTLYDTARRLGYLLSEPIFPVAYVYLHYNKVNKAAESILNRRLQYREPATSFVCGFGTFPSICIEDILCIFSDVFIKGVKEKEDVDGTVEKFKKNNWRNINANDFWREKEEEWKNNRGILTRWPEFSKH